MPVTFLHHFQSLTRINIITHVRVQICDVNPEQPVVLFTKMSEGCSGLTS